MQTTRKFIHTTAIEAGGKNWRITELPALRDNNFIHHELKINNVLSI